MEDKLRFLFLFSEEQPHQIKFAQYGKGKKKFDILHHCIRISLLSMAKLCSFPNSVHHINPPISKIYCVRKYWVECSRRTGPLLEKDLK